jgi:hypothetical protein
MPFIQVHTTRVVSPAARRTLGLALAKSYGDSMQTTYHIVNVGFLHYGEGDLARYDASDDGP